LYRYNEVGHALYEQGLNQEHDGLPVQRALSMGRVALTPGGGQIVCMDHHTGCHQLNRVLQNNVNAK
jgi:hypothetical protein